MRMKKESGRKKKQILKPDYYDYFRCIADRCPLTCCQEWKIAVDERTLEKWKRTSAPMRDEKLDEFTTWKDDTLVIALNGEHDCPFFNGEKLCDLVTAYGDEILSETCRTFPREVHDYGDRVEYSLTPGCPAVVDLINGQREFLMAEEESLFFDMDVYVRIRTFFIDLLKRRDLSLETGLLMIFYLALDLLEREPLTEMEFAKYREGNILSELKAAIEHMEFDFLASFEERNELLLDLMENYRREKMYETYLDEIAKAAEQYAQNGEEEIRHLREKLCEFGSVWRSYEPLLRNILCEELFAESLLPGEGLEHMVIKLQWIAMEYAAICQCLFLKWDKMGDLVYEDVRSYIVVLFRMTGYEEEDICEYLENSFESLIWDWGYFALIVKMMEEKNL